MTYSNVKWILKEFDFDRSIVENIEGGEGDFYTDDDNYRFISDDDIDSILKDELLSDNYMLGCFTAWFIADIEKAQTNDDYEILGALMAKNIDEVVESYVSSDGYGNHFNHYDGNDNEITINGNLYHYFRIN